MKTIANSATSTSNSPSSRWKRRSRQTTSHLSPSHSVRTNTYTHIFKYTQGTRSVGRSRPRRGGGVCYRYRATWPRGDRDNTSPPLLSARRFACFDPVPTYLPTYVTYVRIRRHRHHVRSFRHVPLRPTGSYFYDTSHDTLPWRNQKTERRRR